MTTTFKPIKVGGGGYVTAIRISPDGNTRLIRTDTYSDYTWNTLTGQWDANLVKGRWPDAYLFGNGSYEVAIAPNNSNIVYSYSYYVTKSTDGGKTWATTGFSPIWSGPNSQGGTRFIGPKMAVHPTDANTVYLMTQLNGVYYTTDGGATWTHEATVPAAIGGGQGDGIAGTVTFNLTGSAIFISSGGHGLYKGTVGGSFTSVTGGPGTSALLFSVKLSPSGKLFASTNIFQSTPSLWRYTDGSPGTWDSMAVPQGGQTVVCDPNNANRVLYGNSGGSFMFSLDADAATPTWSSPVPLNPRTTGAGEPGWLSLTNEGFFSEGDGQFDPVVSNRLWLAEGIGLWFADLGTAGTPASMTFQSRNRGIEGMVAEQIRSTPNGGLVVAQWDRGVIKLNPNALDTYNAVQTIDLGEEINACWSLEYATSDPNFMVALMECIHAPPTAAPPSYSTDGGSSWTAIPTFPVNTLVGPDNPLVGGSIAVSTSTNWVWQATWDHDLWRTSNGGTTWTKIDMSALGVPLSTSTLGAPGVETGWGHGTYGSSIRHRSIAADRGTTGIFYAMNTGGGSDPSYAGIYKSVDGGVTWTRPHSGVVTFYTFDFWSCHLECVPKLTAVDTTGHFFYTSGQSGASAETNTAPADTPLIYSLNGGTTLNRITNVKEVYAFGFGAAAAGKDYPTIFVAGYVDYGSGFIWGIHKAEANVADLVANTITWQMLTDPALDGKPYGWYDEIRTIDGDKLVAGKVYFGYSGSSFGYGALASSNVVGFSVIHGHARRHTKMIGY